MSLQKHFSAKRFSNSLKYDISLHGKTYLLAIIVLFILLFVVDLYNINAFNSQMEFYENNQASMSFDINTRFFETSYIPVFTIFLLLGLIISAGTSFSALRSNTNSINYLLIPASNFEKVLVQFLIRIVGFLIVFIPLYWLTFKLSYHFYELFEPVSETVKNYHIFSPFYQDELEFIGFYVITMAITTCTLFTFAGATYFKKYALFKSIFAFALTAIFVFLLMVILSHIFYDHSSKELFVIKSQSYLVSEGLTDKDIFLAVLFSGISLILLPLAYFNLKEREA